MFQENNYVFPNFSQAQAKLGHLRVEASRIKSALERKITLHKSAVKRAKTIERNIQVEIVCVPMYNTCS